MRTKLTHFVAAIVRRKLHIFAAIIALFPAIASAQEYAVTDLGDLGGGTSTATAVNRTGQVAGYSAANYVTEEANIAQVFPFIYSNGTMNMIYSDLMFYWNYGLAMNDNGVVVGEFSNYGTNAFLWNGALQDLAPNIQSYASAINENGVAVGANGYIQGPTENNDGFLVGGEPIGVIFSGGNILDIPTGPYVSVSPTGINNAEQISAECMTSNGVWDGCLIAGNTHKLLQPAPAYGGTQPFAINASGDTCGYSFKGLQSAPTSITATYWKGTTPTNLGTPANTHNSECLGMDNFVEGVGDASTGTNATVGVIFDPLHGARDLNKLISQIHIKGHGFQIQNAVSISDTGFIAANCLLQNGYTHACLLTPNTVLILHDNVLAWADAQVVCIPCQTSLIEETKSLPKSLVGLNADQRERALNTVDRIGAEIESLERSRKISQLQALLLIHEAQLVAAALEPSR